jgi:hypothetical protein
MASAETPSPTPASTSPTETEAPEQQEVDPKNPGGRKRSRLNMAVSDETLALYSAARGFLLAEWFGALLLVASFTLLYLLYAQGHDLRVVLGVSLGCLVLGTWIFWRSRRVYQGLSFNYSPRLHTLAGVTAASGAIFWLLFAVLLVLTYAKVPVLPAGK